MTDTQDGTSRIETLEERTAETFRKTSFLSAGPGSFGLVPDALPVSTRYIMVGASGPRAAKGGCPLRYGCPGGGAENFMTQLYPMLHQDERTADLIRMALGDCKSPQEHLLTRLCAVLVETEVFRILSGESEESDGTAALSQMKQTLPACLHDFRCSMQGKGADGGEKPEEQPGLTPRTDGAYDKAYAKAYDQVSVSFCACRVRHDGGSGRLSAEIYSAGDFCIYLLDRNGLSPLWSSPSRSLTSDKDKDTEIVFREMDISGPGPFALLLLSGGLCQSARTNRRLSADAQGRLWRERMQLEEQVLCVFDGAASEDAFGQVATQVFSSRVTESDSVSGTMIWLSSEDASYNEFRSLCQERLSAVRNMLSLLPEDYDPDREVRQDTLAHTEQAYVAELFRTRPQLLNKTMDMLEACIKDKLAVALNPPEQAKTPDPQTTEGMKPGMLRGYATDMPTPSTQGSPEAAPMPPDQVRTPAAETAGGAEAVVLTPEVVLNVYQRFDRENEGDRAQIRKNQTVISRALRGHWMTLRSLLSQVQGARTEVGKAEEEVGSRIYQTCLDMNNRLEAMLKERQARLEGVKDILSGSLTVLDGSFDDWVIGRGSRNVVSEWLRGLTETLPPLLEPMKQGWAEETEQLRSLQTAYTSEREALFMYDTDAGHGIFHGVFTQMTEGTLPDAMWEAFIQTAEKQEKLTGYDEMLKALRVVSREIDARNCTIRGRDAQRRCVLAMRADFDWQFACLRASVYASPPNPSADESGQDAESSSASSAKTAKSDAASKASTSKDSGWPPDIWTLLDPGTRNSYLGMVQQWQQAENLYSLKKKSFDDYRSMYEAGAGRPVAGEESV